MESFYYSTVCNFCAKSKMFILIANMNYPKMGFFVMYLKIMICFMFGGSIQPLRGNLDNLRTQLYVRDVSVYYF